ncbi:MAG TPA: hypothetical protein VHY22_03895 [Chthoniobacteraceae bacterium]|jgi:hypothetical protein|nr:hypothetical protein [Chthoniobacteraceae bacterium]
MDYLYENLGEDRFQEMCQSLLIEEFPNVQSFPIRQPDGGRDILVYLPNPSTGRAFAVFQVKYVKKPQAEKDIHKWLVKIMEGELPKIRKLIPKGAKAYYLLTNIGGTAHLDSGSIDQLNALFQSLLPIPSYCWWRDDLNQRLDKSFDLKWLYPQLLTGVDMLRLVVQQNLSADAERRTNTIRAFVRAQFEDDKEVRFKQVELQNDLISLFVDVPIGVKRGFQDHQRHFLQHFSNGNPAWDDEDKVQHAATLLLNSSLRQICEQVVLEGAPGQGKSTIAQYICQVHRMYLLNERELLEKLPKPHRADHRCIPIKVDLRDLAAWLNKRNPFSPDELSEIPPHWAKSLEAFLAALIRNQSGGADFTVSDLHAIAQLSSILLVLDGLDEVADLIRRKEVINEVTLGVSRLRTLAARLQVVVTSRPTAFGPALGFNERQFPHLELLSLSQRLISQYADNWLTARRLKPSEAATIRKILKQKIEQTHLRDLTRNPMQLTILLSLIHTRGSSLPEKRTALYDGYVELFFNRESEKSEIVREHRDLLIDLHRYLAWILHSEAETNQQRGSISTEKFQKLLRAYLSSEQRDDSSVADLFTGMVERIVFLVSRVEGTLEFEVQPLREYFVAKYLYDTAPYSPPGREMRGTKPDRFDAIAKNPYWSNVTRFYAGCFSKGELPCLIDRLEYLAEAEKPRFSNRQRRLASYLLRDWVFTQDQRSMQRAVSLVLDGVSLRHPSRRRRRNVSPMDDELVLPPGSGRDELVSSCFRTLEGKPKNDIASETCQLIVANSSSEIVDAIWKKEFLKASGPGVTRWLRYGLYLGALARFDSAELEAKLEPIPPTAEQLDITLNAGHNILIENSESFSKTLLDAILADQARAIRSNIGVLGQFAEAIQPSRYISAFRNPVPQPLRIMIRPEERGGTTIKAPNAPNEILSQCLEYVSAAEREINRLAAEWANDPTPWRSLTELARGFWGERPVLFQMANLAASINSNDEPSDECSTLLDSSACLCGRVRYARLRAGSGSWWERQFDAIRTPIDRILVLLTFLSWGGIKTLVKYIARIDAEISNLTFEDWAFLARSLPLIVNGVRTRKDKIPFDELPKKIDERTILAISFRATADDSRKLYSKFLQSYSGGDKFISGFCVRTILESVDSQPKLWQHLLIVLKGLDGTGPARDPYHFFRGVGSVSQTIPLEVAKQMANEANNYPRAWVYAAAERCEIDAASQVEAVGSVAHKEGWFKRQ